MAESHDFEPVPTPGIKSWERSPSGVRAKTRAHEAKLLEIFRSPPADYDGSNKYLASTLSVSERQITRILRAMEDRKLIRIECSPGLAWGRFFTRRRILIPAG